MCHQFTRELKQSDADNIRSVASRILVHDKDRFKTAKPNLLTMIVL